jgi:hypothetical protein
LTTNWTHHILSKNVDGEGITSFWALPLRLKKEAAAVDL